MPQLPQILENPTPQASGPATTPIAVPQGDAVAKATAGLGQEIQKVGATVFEVKDQRDKYNYSMARSSFYRQVADLENSVKDDPDYTSMSVKYQDGVKDIKKNLLDSLGDNRFSNIFSENIDKISAQQIGQINQLAAKKQQATGLANAVQSANQNLDAYIRTSNPQIRDSLIISSVEDYKTAIPDSNPEKPLLVEKYTQETGDKFATARLNSLNPYRQLFLLEEDRRKPNSNFTSNIYPDKRVELYNQAQSAVRALEDKKIDTTMVNLALQDKLVLDPTLPQNQKAVDVVWADRQENLMNQGASKEQVLNSSLDMVAKIGMMPSPVKSVLTANVINGNTEQKATYSKYIGDAVDLNPKVLNGLDREAVGTAIAISNNLRSGLSAQQAVDWVNKYQDQARKESIESKTKSWENLNKGSFKNSDKKIVDLLQAQPGFNFFEKNPQVPQAMIDDYKRLSKGFYVNDNLDSSSSNTVAEKMVRSQWGVTEIGGQKKYMKYAPEVIYGNQDNWIHKQLESDFKMPIKDLNLEINYSTINTQNPTYFAYKKNPFGGTDIILDEHNLPKQFIPKFHQANMEKVNEELKNAQNDRQSVINIENIVNEDKKNSLYGIVPVGR